MDLTTPCYRVGRELRAATTGDLVATACDVDTAEALLRLLDQERCRMKAESDEAHRELPFVINERTSRSRYENGMRERLEPKPEPDWDDDAL